MAGGKQARETGTQRNGTQFRSRLETSALQHNNVKRVTRLKSLCRLIPFTYDDRQVVTSLNFFPTRASISACVTRRGKIKLQGRVKEAP